MSKNKSSYRKGDICKASIVGFLNGLNEGWKYSSQINQMNEDLDYILSLAREVRNQRSAVRQAYIDKANPDNSKVVVIEDLHRTRHFNHPFYVKAHPMKLSNGRKRSSEKDRFIKENGINLNEDQTWVFEYSKGDK